MFDVDGSGRVSAAEFRNGLRALTGLTGVSITDSQVSGSSVQCEHHLCRSSTCGVLWCCMTYDVCRVPCRRTLCWSAWITTAMALSTTWSSCLPLRLWTRRRDSHPHPCLRRLPLGTGIRRHQQRLTVVLGLEVGMGRGVCALIIARMGRRWIRVRDCWIEGSPVALCGVGSRCRGMLVL
jgi:hypothetical protein